ncbi:hypothetical protein FOZ62_029914, partial [Perkinsus olseni]
DGRWDEWQKQKLNAEARGMHTDTPPPQLKVESVREVLKGKGFKVSLFQTQRGVGIGCQIVEERLKVKQSIDHSDDKGWSVSLDQPRLCEIKIRRHGYGIEEGSKLLDDMIQMNGLKCAAGDLRVSRITAENVYIKEPFKLMKDIENKFIYLDCVRVRVQPCAYVNQCYKCGSLDRKHDFRTCDRPPICKICGCEGHKAQECLKEGEAYRSKSRCVNCGVQGHGTFDILRCPKIRDLQARIMEKNERMAYDNPNGQ